MQTVTNSHDHYFWQGKYILPVSHPLGSTHRQYTKTSRIHVNRTVKEIWYACQVSRPRASFWCPAKNILRSSLLTRYPLAKNGCFEEGCVTEAYLSILVGTKRCPGKIPWVTWYVSCSIVHWLHSKGLEKECSVVEYERGTFSARGVYKRVLYKTL